MERNRLVFGEHGAYHDEADPGKKTGYWWRAPGPAGSHFYDRFRVRIAPRRGDEGRGPGGMPDRDAGGRESRGPTIRRLGRRVHAVRRDAALRRRPRPPGGGRPRGGAPAAPAGRPRRVALLHPARP